MSFSNNYVWYAAYGSNINEDRFNCYIKGGKPVGARKNYLGCRNKELPIANEEIFIKSELYFAMSSKTWNNSGVAFLRTNFGDSETLGRMYLITYEQFTDVIKQETNQQAVELDLNIAVQKGDYIFSKDSWYGRIVYLGNQATYPIFTFTNNINLPPTKPDPNYLKTIAVGIKQVYSHSDEEIAQYLLGKKGVIEHYSFSELMSFIS